MWWPVERDGTGIAMSAVRGPTQVLRLKEEKTGGWLKRERGVIGWCIGCFEEQNVDVIGC